MNDKKQQNAIQERIHKKNYKNMSINAATVKFLIL